jgi:peptidoglycan/LPS O-acetylase OafA/YrhL
MISAEGAPRNRLDVLDGWRGLSIALVLWGHLFPAGPRAWGMNEAVAGSGMAIFFILSGFLITTGLQRDPRVVAFLVRRFARIIPLAWLAITVTLLASSVTAPSTWMRLLTFTANVPPEGLTEYTSHFWSLCLEVQFYVGIAILVTFGGRPALWLLPLFALAITGLRIADHRLMDIGTQYRLDEILAGCILALAHGRWRDQWQGARAYIVPLFLVLLLASSHPATGWLNYCRPYIAMAMIGNSLWMSQAGWVSDVLCSRPLAYLARISYALYVLHGGLRWTWLGTGDTTAVKYLKRPLLLAVTFALSHWSTFHFESRFNQWARRLTGRRAA